MDVLTRVELVAVLAFVVRRIGWCDVALASWWVALTCSAIEAVDDEVDGEVVAEFGPGTVLGERALIEDHGTRTATLRAVTKCKIACAGRGDIAPESLAELSQTHLREHRHA
jgi:hypothetical protein